MSSYQELVHKYKDDARNLLLQAAKLEVKAREDRLQHDALDALIKITTNLVIEEYVRDKSENIEHFYNEKQLALKIARHYIGNVDAAMHTSLYFDSGASCKATMDKIINKEGKDTSDFSTVATPADNRVSTKIRAILTELFPKITIELWSTMKERELLRQINAEQALFNEKQETKTATEEATELIARDPIIPHSQLKAAVTEMIDKQFKSMQVAARKKYLADSKSQESGATKNGQNSNKTLKRKELPSKTAVSVYKTTKRQKTNHQPKNILPRTSNPLKQREKNRGGRHAQQGRGRGGREGVHSGGRGRR